MTTPVNPYAASSQGISSLSRHGLGRRQQVSEYGRSQMDAEFAAKCEPLARAACECSSVVVWTVRACDVGKACWACGAKLRKVA